MEVVPKYLVKDGGGNTRVDRACSLPDCRAQALAELGDVVHDKKRIAPRGGWWKSYAQGQHLPGSCSLWGFGKVHGYAYLDLNTWRRMLGDESDRRVGGQWLRSGV